MALHILPHRADLFAGATAAVEHAAAIFRAAVNGEGKIFAAVFTGAHHDFFLNALAQRKVDQVVHSRLDVWKEIFVLQHIFQGLSGSVYREH